MLPELSIVLPVYNASAHLAEALESICLQTFQNWECLCLNDGSTDRSAQILARYAQRDKRFRLIRLPHQGIVTTLNYGLEKCRGAFIGRMDADDFSHPDRFQSQIAFLKQHPDLGCASCLVEYLGDREKYKGYASYVDGLNQWILPQEIEAARFIESPLAHPSVCFRRSIVEKFGNYRDGDFPEDYELWLRWMSQGVLFAKVPQCLLRWRDSPERLSRSDERYRSDAFYRLKLDYLSRWIQTSLPESRPIWIWGAGKIARKWTSYLRQKKIPIAGYIDVDPAKNGSLKDGLPVAFYQDGHHWQNAFILSMVGSRGARQQIEAYLQTKGLRPRQDYLLCA